jgi:predicted O-methyltransferase YrrM
MMEEILDINLWKYLEAHSEKEPELLKQLNRETHLKALKPRMLSGHFQGRFLSLISKLIKPGRILEIGTFTGYSALCLAEGLGEEGELYTLEANPEPLFLARKYFELSPFGKKIKVFEGKALEIIPQLHETFDLVFIDADKKNNRLYFDLLIEKVTSGGIILVDNVLWSGKILKGETDSKTEEIREFNEYIHTLNRVESMILPIRDGLMWIRKKE